MENLFVTVVNIAYHIAIGVADWQFFSQYEMPYILITLHACCLSDDYGILIFPTSVSHVLEYIHRRRE